MPDLDRYAPQAWQLVEAHLDAAERTIIAESCKAVASGIDPQFAVQQWIALSENRKLRQKLERSVRGFRAEARRTGQAFDKQQVDE